MKYLQLPYTTPATFLSCGRLVKRKNFIHPKRLLDSFVLIYVLEGALYICQNETEYEVLPGQYILLHAETIHYGYRVTEDQLKYYWAHFHIDKPYKFLTPQDGMTFSTMAQDEGYTIPEYGHLDRSKRIPVLFSQLCDFSMHNYNSYFIFHYSLTILLQELAFEVQEQSCLESAVLPHIQNIQNWIRKNYHQTITVTEIAELFHYNPDYLSNNFKKATKTSLSQYINQIRIQAAKHYLTSTRTQVKEIAYCCGFSDDKYFMKVFHDIVNMTPTEYRNAFYQQKEVSN